MWPPALASCGKKAPTLLSFSDEGHPMLQRLKAVVFDVDAASLTTLREALPGWHIKVVYGATVGSLPCDWNPGAVDLLVVGVREDVSETLALCRFLADCTSHSRDSWQETADSWGLRGAC
jgi:hypothetical protein